MPPPPPNKNQEIKNKKDKPLAIRIPDTGRQRHDRRPEFTFVFSVCCKERSGCLHGSSRNKTSPCVLPLLEMTQFTATQFTAVVQLNCYIPRRPGTLPASLPAGPSRPSKRPLFPLSLRASACPQTRVFLT